MKSLNDKEVHQLAMQEVGSFLEKEGYEFLAVNSQLKRSPQFVCVKDQILYFVVVKGCLYPKSPKSYDLEHMNKVKIHAEKNQAKLLFAGVGFADATNYSLPLYKNNSYVVNFSGLEKIL
jgi:hypothetical protein